MTRKRYIKLVVALSKKILEKEGKHLVGENLKFYRDTTLAKINGYKYKSYAEAWDDLKALRDIVEM